MIKDRYKLMLAGAGAGLLNGLFGAGGGMILVPLLIGWVGIDEKRAFATSVAIMFPLSIVSYVLFCLRGENVWEESLPYLMGGIAGGILSIKLFRHIPTKWLHRVFAGLLLYGGIKTVLGL